MEYCVAVVLGYLLGCVNPAYLIGKAKGFDIRTKGTGNAGASNAKVTMGFGVGAFCAVYDAAKALISVMIMSLVFPGNETAAVLAGVCAVWGHCYPFYLQFRGGKGFASYMGLILALNWKYFLILLAVGIFLTVVTNWIVTATFTCVISFPIYNWLTNSPTAICVFLTITSLMIVYKHRVNIVKILSKQEIGLNGKMVGINLLNKEKVVAK